MQDAEKHLDAVQQQQQQQQHNGPAGATIGVAAGGEGLRTLSLPGATPIEGGLPLIHEGRIIGAIGISGVTSVQDGQIARAGVAALAPKS
jgi:uncharacterized protein GlcG (DUF336 family)